MTDLRKAAEMALEALTRAHPISNSGKHLYAHSEAMAALSQALAEPANSTTDFVEPKASSQPEQEPVAWMYEWDGRINFTTTDQRFVEAAHPHFVKSTPLYTAPPKREWVGLTDEEMMRTNQRNANCSIIDSKLKRRTVEAKLKEKKWMTCECTSQKCRS
jgi:hypothetical protein